MVYQRGNLLWFDIPRLDNWICKHVLVCFTLFGLVVQIIGFVNISYDLCIEQWLFGLFVSTPQPFSLQAQLQQEKERFDSMHRSLTKENGKLVDSIAKLEEEKTRRMPPDVQGEVRRLKRENHKQSEELRKRNEQVNDG